MKIKSYVGRGRYIKINLRVFLSHMSFFGIVIMFPKLFLFVRKKSSIVVQRMCVGIR